MLILTDQKNLPDESVLQKIDRFSKEGVKREFFINDQKEATIISRLNRNRNDQNWLSLQPDSRKWEPFRDKDFGFRVGEMSQNNILHGRGIKIYDDG